MDLTPQLSIIRTVPGNRNYWLLPTYSGHAFTNFYTKNYIRVPSPHHLQPFGHFYHEIIPEDYVVIASPNNEMWAIGEVYNGIYTTYENVEYPETRRDVKWLAMRSVSEFKGELDTLLHVTPGISQVNDFGNVFESQVSSLFRVENVAHLVIQIEQHMTIPTHHLNAFLHSLHYFYRELWMENGVDLPEELFIKIKVQSKGNVAFASAGVIGLLGLSLLFTLSDEPTVKLELGETGRFEAEGNGLLQSWSEFLDAKQERQIQMIRFMESKEVLQAETRDSFLLSDSVLKGSFKSPTDRMTGSHPIR